MNAAAVVEQLNIVKDSRPRLLAGGKVTVVNQLIFQVREEAFSHGIVVGTLAPTYARTDSCLTHHRPIRTGSVQGSGNQSDWCDAHTL